MLKNAIHVPSYSCIPAAGLCEWDLFLQCPFYFTLACTTALGCHSPRVHNRFRQKQCSSPRETLAPVSSIIKTPISLQSLIVTFISAAWPFECTHQPDTSKFLHGCKVPDAHSLHSCYHSSSQARWETILFSLLLWRCTISVFAGLLASVFRPHSSERKGFHMFCFLTASFGHCSETREL